MRCRFSWCSIAHTPGSVEHRTAPAQIGDLTLFAILIEGHEDEPDGMVRLVYTGPRMLIEFQPAVASEVAYVLGRVEGEHAGQVAAAVRAAADALLEAGGPR